MKKKPFFLALLGLGLALPKLSLAHCPLCTVGAGFLAVLAASLGVKSLVVAILLGAFSLALALWLAKKVKKQYFRGQFWLLTVLIFVLTALPLAPLLQEYGPLYLNLAGEYGSPLHNTYTINLYYLGVLIGAALLFGAPWLSRGISKVRRGRRWPFQSLSVSLGLLVLTSLLIQFL